MTGEKGEFAAREVEVNVAQRFPGHWGTAC